MKHYLKLIICCFIGTALADASTANLTCPNPSDLKKDSKTLTWYAGTTPDNSNFKSYDTSFVTKIKAFAGAQWQGEKVGKIQCVYEPEDKYTFSVVLYFGHLAIEPSAGQWGNNLGGYRNCIAANNKPLTPADCAFQPVMSDTSGNPYQELDNLKDNNENNS